MAYQFATYEKKGRLAVVTINRPEQDRAPSPKSGSPLGRRADANAVPAQAHQAGVKAREQRQG